jgi:hypothetical protein
MLCNLIKQAVCTPLDIISAGLSFIAVILAVSIPFHKEAKTMAGPLNAKVIMAKYSSTNKAFGIWIEQRGRDWVRTWAFPINEAKALTRIPSAVL